MVCAVSLLQDHHGGVSAGLRLLSTHPASSLPGGLTGPEVGWCADPTPTCAAAGDAGSMVMSPQRLWHMPETMLHGVASVTASRTQAAWW